MSNSDFDPNKFKASQRQSWDSVAKGWQKWWKTFESGAQRVSDRLVELAEIKPGQRVLDLATGIGEPAITAAKIVGNGHVLATDISAQMLAIAEERAKSLGLQDKMEFREIDAENLDSLPKLAFDAILSRWGLMFLPNLEIALRDMQRLLVSRGKLALQDRKSTRLNSSHPSISYAVFCLKKKIRTGACTVRTGASRVQTTP